MLIDLRYIYFINQVSYSPSKSLLYQFDRISPHDAVHGSVDFTTTLPAAI